MVHTPSLFESSNPMTEKVESKDEVGSRLAWLTSVQPPLGCADDGRGARTALFRAFEVPSAKAETFSDPRVQIQLRDHVLATERRSWLRSLLVSKFGFETINAGEGVFEVSAAVSGGASPKPLRSG